MNIEQARYNMIEQQIRPWEVLDQDVLSRLGEVRREQFVPENCRDLAFVDTQIPLPGGQCMLEPKVEARLLQELAVQPGERVLEVGAGSGYMAALLASQAEHVLSIEIDPALARFARDNLRRAGIGNVSVFEGDGARGHAAESPFDIIVLSGSVAELPQELLEQLKVGGRLVAVVGEAPAMAAMLVTCTGAGAYRRETLFETAAPRLRGFAEPTRFRF